MNTISLVDLEITCIIGIHPHERIHEQKLFLDINLEVDFKDSTIPDDINSTIDYTLIAELAT